MQIAPIAGNNMRLIWPTLTGATLESKVDLILPPDWQEVTGVTIEDVNGTSSVEIPIESEDSHFFRLRW
jgi:hypothetical protein